MDVAIMTQQKFLFIRAMQRASLLLFLLFCSAVPTVAQNQTPPSETIIFTEEPSEADLERLEQWQDYRAHPTDLNAASLTHLRSLPFLHEGEPEAIVAFRERYQTFAAVTDLLWVENLSRERAAELLPFFCVNEPHFARFHKQSVEIYQRASYRFLRAVKTKKNVLGNPLGLETRLDYRVGDALRMALRGRTQPYEPFASRENPYGHAAYSGFGQMTFAGECPARLVVGHFSYLAGYGLTFSSSNASFPSERPLSPQGDRYLPRGCFASPSSATPLGIAVTSRLGRSFLLTSALSYRPVNATYRDLKGGRYLRTVDISGSFDTPARQKWRNVTREILALLDLKFLRQHYALGVAGVYDHFREPFLTPVAATAELKLQSQLHLGLYGRYRRQCFQLWGELAAGGLGVKKGLGDEWERTSALLAAGYQTDRYGSWTLEGYHYGIQNPSRYQRNFSRASHPRGRWGANLHYVLWRSWAQFAVAYRFHHNTSEKAWRHELALSADLPFAAGRALFLRYKTSSRAPHYAARHDLKARFSYPLSRAMTLVSQGQLVWVNQKATLRFASPSLFLSQRLDYHARVLILALFLAGFYGGQSPAEIYYGEPSFRYTSPVHSVRRTGGRVVLLSRFRFLRFGLLGCRLGVTFEASKRRTLLASYDVQLQLGFVWE